MRLKNGIVVIDRFLKPRLYQKQKYAFDNLKTDDAYKLIIFFNFEKAQQFAKEAEQIADSKEMDTLEQKMVKDIDYIFLKNEYVQPIKNIIKKKINQNIQKNDQNVENTKLQNNLLNNNQDKNIDDQNKQQDCYGILDEIEEKLKKTSISRQRLVQLEKLDKDFEQLLNYYPKAVENIPIKADNLYSLYFDGASRSNPGPSGAGVALFDRLIQIKEISQPLQKQTNNSAEFLALFIGVRYALNLGINYLECFGDSKLIIDGMNNKLNFKQPHLEFYRSAINDYTKLFKQIRYIHISRDENKIADKLASNAAEYQKMINR